jgi:hypothetical protein
MPSLSLFLISFEKNKKNIVPLEAKNHITVNSLLWVEPFKVFKDI